MILLDNPAWWALNSLQASFAVGNGLARRYRPDILPFAAVAEPSVEAVRDLDVLVKEGEHLFLIGGLPPLPRGWTVEAELPCAQMIHPEGTPVIAGGPEIVSLEEKDREEMYTLIDIVQPGYYKRDTPLLGDYFGIRQEGKLVAMAGERMRMAGPGGWPGTEGVRSGRPEQEQIEFSELSAIGTLPGYTGRQYAQYLIAQLCRCHMKTGIRSYLHVLKTNERAIRLYELMGFIHRRDITFWKIRKGT